jgi:hypothetical protein
VSRVLQTLHQRVVAAEKERDDAAEQLFDALKKVDAAAEEVKASQELRLQLEVRVVSCPRCMQLQWAAAATRCAQMHAAAVCGCPPPLHATAVRGSCKRCWSYVCSIAVRCLGQDGLSAIAFHDLPCAGCTSTVRGVSVSASVAACGVGIEVAACWGGPPPGC